MPDRCRSAGYGVLHPTCNGDILDAADLVGGDAAADRVAEIFLEETQFGLKPPIRIS